MKTKLLLLLFLANFSIYAQTNLVPNGNFETWTSSSKPDNWYQYFSGYISKSTSAQNGSSSVNMMVASGTFNFINSEFFPVTAGKTYKVTMYHKLVKGTFSSVDFSVYHKPGTFKEEITKKTDVTFSTTEWRKIEFDYTPTVSENIEVDIWTTGSLNSEILVDNVSFVDVNEVPLLYTTIPDKEFERYLAYMGYDKDGINGKTLTSAISSIKTLDISTYNWNIANLSGIEDFTALENLTYKGNIGKISTINVSKNTKLKTLDLSSNLLTTLDISANLDLESLICESNKLTALDVSKHTKLKTLKLNSNDLTAISVLNNKELTTFSTYNNSKITSLDVSQNVLLVDLNCAFNQLTTLDISKNVLLTSLYCDGNKFTDLNLSKNPLLVSIRTANNSLASLDVTNQPNLKILECYRNKIISLDLSKNTLLTSLACYNNELKELNLTKNIELVYLDGLSNKITTLDLTQNTKLTSAYIHYNSLMKLDVSKNTLLKYLDIGNNPISTIDFSNNLKLESISANNSSIKSLDISKQADLLSLYLSGTKIESLDLSKNKKLINAGLSFNKYLYDLNLKNENNTKLNVTLQNNLSLLCVLVDSKSYADTNWSTKKDIWTKFSEDCRPYTAIPDPNFEDKLIALKIDVDGKNGQVLTSSIAQIKTLDVSNNTISNLTGIQDFASLETLNCKDNQLLFLDLSKNTALTSVNASNNKLVSLDLKNGKNTLLNKSTSLFTNNASLKCIQVDDENYSNTNWSALKDASANYNTLCNAFVSIPDANFENKLISLGIDVDGKNGKVLTASIAAVTTLDISSSSISNLAGIEGFTALKQLNISSNALKAVDLSKNISLTTLNVKSNQLLNLDLSKNTALTEVDCSSNNLYSLNLKNANNSKIQNAALINFKSNPNLTCIQVDDKAFADTNWASAKETAASYNVTCDNASFTLIPDPVFENKLITLGIDKDGVNGGVLTSSISSLKELSIYIPQGSSEPTIKDLTGIQDFKALQKLSVDNNQLRELDLSANTALTDVTCQNNRLISINISKNTLLYKLDCSTNFLTKIDFSNNPALYEASCRENSLTSLDFSNNPNFGYLSVANNKLTNINITKNPNLNYVNCAGNLLETIDFSNNRSINYLFIQNNRLKTLDISKVTSVMQFGCDSNQLTTIDVSKNGSLSQFSIGDNQLTALDLSANTNLWTLYCPNNKLTTLNLSKNKKLSAVNCSFNNLTSVNVKNGNNVAGFSKYLDSEYYLNFKNNPNLTCIQVDDITFASTKMASSKDAIASYNTNCGATLVLPANNFTVETKGESCQGENNGEINVTAKGAYAYEAVLNGKTVAFNNNSVKIDGLAPGTYTIAVIIAEENFEQFFNFTIQKATTTTGKSSITSKSVNVEITEGTAPFTVFIDGAEQFQTTDANFSVELNKAGLVEVATSKACEGVFAKKVTSYELGTILSAYPNPTSGTIQIEIPSTKTEVAIELYNFGGQLVSKGNYNIESGSAVLDLQNLPSGIYAAKIYLETPEYIKIIKK